MTDKETQAYAFHRGAFAKNIERRTRMTFREKLAQEHPERVDPRYDGGCRLCPHAYGYESDRPSYCDGDSYFSDDHCRACWDREIPEETIVEEPVKEPAEEKEGCFVRDSGERTVFPTGAVRDMREGKGRCDLIPLGVMARYIGHHIGVVEAQPIYFIDTFRETGDTRALEDALYHFCLMNHNFMGCIPTMFLEVAKQFEEGAKKYGDSNWQKGVPIHCYIDSAIRHYLKWLRGDKDEPHDRAFVWNIVCCIWEASYSPRAKAVPNEVNAE